MSWPVNFLWAQKKSDKWSEPREQPQHKVFLDEYYIGRFPVTNKQYRAYIAETGAELPMYLKEGRVLSTAENHPVIFCNWLDAVGFCDWARIKTGLNIRLPSEAEWEKAARGTDGRLYPWGNHYDWEKRDRQIMNASWDQRKGALATNEVGRSPDTASPYGCENMAGSVVEE